MRTGTGEVQRFKTLTMTVMKGDKVHSNLLMLLKDLFEKQDVAKRNTSADPTAQLQDLQTQHILYEKVHKKNV